MENVYQLPDKKKMAYYEWKTSQPAKGGSTPVVIVCVHGITSFGLIFDFLAKGLIDDAHKRGIDCRIYAVDLIGRGNSDWFDHPEDYKPEAFVRHLAVFIEVIRTQNKVEKVNYIGTSFGGMIGMGLFYGGFGSLINKIILNDVGATLEHGGLSRVEGKLSRKDVTFSGLDEAEQFFRESRKGLGTLSDDEWKFVTKCSVKKENDCQYCMKTDPKLHAMGEHKQSKSLWDFYARIDCPVLIIHGENSDILF
eukprot:TRINITY_DN5160_c0_g1_i3.p1 TRINITY_DN5160_c0_g1~~TRINITY_DN5160_c0_g1_i3.p1  ORF type:complete len:251 (+),score=51.42 TRINITY_DN5160_c0_g1_i3:220-972(+)